MVVLLTSYRHYVINANSFDNYNALKSMSNMNESTRRVNKGNQGKLGR